MFTEPDPTAALKRHLNDGERALVRLEAEVTALLPGDRPAAALLAGTVLVPLRQSVAEVRGRLTASRAWRRGAAL